MKRTELKRITPLVAKACTLRRTELARKTPMKPGTKRMRQSRSTDKPTAAESARIVLVKKLGCICCMLNVQFWMPVPYRGVCEAHHLLSGGLRRGHLFTIGLCRWHHQAVPPRERMSESAAIAVYGPSVATGSKPFHVTYGSDDELLEFQNALLAQASALMGEG
jgi:hypothetical protein